MGKGIKRPDKPDKDFSKKKFKVGKRLKKADNETKVDVRVRKLNLPGQTALEDKDDYATTDKRLTLKVRVRNRSCCFDRADRVHVAAHNYKVLAIRA